MKAKLTFRFHNPNTVEVTADYVLKLCIQAAQPKLEEAMREAKEEKYQTEKSSSS